MANEEQNSSGTLRGASKYLGVLTGAVVAMGRGIGRTCESGAKTVGGLFVPCKKEDAESPVAAEPGEAAESTFSPAVKPSPAEEPDDQAEAEPTQDSSPEEGTAEDSGEDEKQKDSS